MPDTFATIRHRTIFLAALDWGLGHATRCVPIVRQLLDSNKILLGVTPATEAVFRQEFPELEMIRLPAYNIRYSRHIPLFVKLAGDSPRIGRVIAEEQQQLRQIVEQYGVDLIISDNRFGLYHAQVESIYITHQLHVQAGIWSGLANRVHRRYMQRYSRIWVPDHQDRQKALAGLLSAETALGVPLEYTGPLSRLQIPGEAAAPTDVLILLSGVEPQRSLLEEALCNVCAGSKKKIVLVRGSTSPATTAFPGQLQVIDLADAAQLSALIQGARRIVCRSGYSTLMDLHTFGKKELVLIPTPGQTEQEYLARHWQQHFGASLLPQAEVRHWKP